MSNSGGRTESRARGWADGRLSSFLAFQIYFALLYLAYVTYLTDAFAEQGYELVPDESRALWCQAVMGVLSLLLKHRARITEFLLHFALALLVAPSLVLYAGGGLELSYALLTCAAFLTVLAVAHVPAGELPSGLVSTTTLCTICFGLGALYIGLVVLFGGLRFLNFDFTLIYEYRRDSASELPGFFAYASPMVGKVLLPFGLTLSLAEKRYGMVTGFLAGAVLIFGLTAHKSVLFFPPMIIVVFLISKTRTMNLLIVLVLSTLVAGSVYDMNNTLYYAAGNEAGWLSSLLLRRALFVPALLNNCYFDYFSGSGEFLYWAESRITIGFVPSPIDMKVVNLIGLECFNKPDMSANTGFIGSGFANAGWVGVLAYAALLGLILVFCEAASAKHGLGIALPLTIVPISVALLSSDLLVTLGTHGLALTMLLLAAMKPPAPGLDAAVADRAVPQDSR